MFRRLVLLCLGLALGACAISRLPKAAFSPSPAPTRTPVPANTPTPGGLPSPAQTPRPLPSPIATATTTAAATGLPRPKHTVVVILENEAFGNIFGNACCPFLNQQANASALMTRSFAVTHPSQPNYLDLFSGSDQGVRDDACPVPGAPFSTPNLGQQLIDAGLTFAGFAEDLPASGPATCDTSTFALKHVPWADFSNVPEDASRHLSSFLTDFSTLPTVSFVIPNQCDDMHNCGPGTGDTWLNSNLNGYIQWAALHQSLLIVTFDEGDYDGANQIVTFFEGPMVRPGQYSERINHFNVLRTLEALYGLPFAGQAAHVTTITDIWNQPAP